MATRLKRDFECLGIDYNAFYPGNKQLESLEALQPAPEVNGCQVFFYHSYYAFARISRSIGSSNFITNANGDATQHLEYTLTEPVQCLPFGETLAEQQNGTSYYSPFKFSAKEKDIEMRSIREDRWKINLAEQTGYSTLVHVMIRRS